MSKIYLASSWRNMYQPALVDELREHGHEVYDFRNPKHNTGFAWNHVGLDAATTAKEYRDILYTHPIAARGFMSDFRAMQWADTCVLLLPCGRSAHLEAGWFCGANKRTIILTRDGEEPELMALMATYIATSMTELFEALK